MADTFTANLGIRKPALKSLGWGTKLNNEAFDVVDAVFAAAGNGTSVGLNVGSGKTLKTDAAATVILKGVTLNAAVAPILDNTSLSALLSEIGGAPLNNPAFTGTVTLPADPSSALHAATKQYVDALAVNVGKRQTVRAATTANITISTALNNGDTLDGVSLVTGDLVLVKNQSTASQNGIYVVGTSPARDPQFDSYDEHAGTLIAVREGTANANTLWLCTSNTGGTLGSTAIDFSKMVVAGELLASNNLSDLANAATARSNLGVPTGTSGAVLGFLNGANTWSGKQTLSAGATITPAATPASDEVGYLGAPQNTQNGNYTLVMADAGKGVSHTDATTPTWTIPPNSSVAFPIHTTIPLDNIGSGTVTIARGSGVALRRAGDSTDENKSLAQWGQASLYKVGTDSWLIMGNV